MSLLERAVTDGVMSAFAFDEAVDTTKPRPSGKAEFESSVRFMKRSANGKLSRVQKIKKDSAAFGFALKPTAPFCSSTYVSIAATCSSSCPWKKDGCYVRSGYTSVFNARMDEAAMGMTRRQVIDAEVEAIDAAFLGGVPQDGARGGRDLRLHVGGDLGSAREARVLAGAAQRWRERGGGVAWSYTHSWRDVPREAWGEISVLASVEVPEDAAQARAMGYATAIVVPQFPHGHRLFDYGVARAIPCLAETAGKTCVECRFCMNDRRMHDRGLAVAFLAHGSGAEKVRGKLRVLSGQQSELAL